MSTDIQKATLLEDFQHYLEQSQLQTTVLPEQPDLHTLLSELTGLKAEVKAESRQFKSTLDSLSSALETVQADNAALKAELAAYQQRQEQQQREITRTLLLDMLDLYDRLGTAGTVLDNYQPATGLFKKSRKKDVQFIERFKEGQVMTLRRFEQFLQRHQVQAIDCVGELLDPQTMRAVETGHNPTFANGIVLEELRKGFLLHDQVLRLADVNVNKLNPR